MGPQGLNYDQIKKADLPLTQDREVALLAWPPESELLLRVIKSKAFVTSVGTGEVIICSGWSQLGKGRAGV